MLTYHIREEESVIFKDAQVHLPERQMDGLLSYYRDARQKEKKELARRVEKKVRVSVT